RDADPSAFRARALRQVRQTLTFVPRYLAISAAHVLGLAALVTAVRGERIALPAARFAVSAMVMLDLLGFAGGLNPAIARAEDRPAGAVIAELKRRTDASMRILPLGAELPPNSLMRYGLCDPRNYDSIELTRSLDWFAPLYEPTSDARTSRRDVSWAGV